MIGAIVLRDESNEIIYVGVELMDLKDLALYLQLNYETVRRWAKAGKLPAFKSGGSWRVRKCELDAWIEEHKVGGASNTKGRSTEQNMNCPKEDCRVGVYADRIQRCPSQ